MVQYLQILRLCMTIYVTLLNPFCQDTPHFDTAAFSALYNPALPLSSDSLKPSKQSSVHLLWLCILPLHVYCQSSACQLQHRLSKTTRVATFSKQNIGTLGDEAPKAPRGVGNGRGCPPHQPTRASGGAS